MNQRKITIPDLVFAAAGLLALVATFLPWWGISESGTIAGQKMSDSFTVNGWNSASHAGDLSKTITGPLAWIPMLVLLLFGVFALVRAYAAPQLLAGKLFYQAGAGVGGLAAALVLVRWVTYYKPPSSVDASGVTATMSSGASFGTYLGLLIALVVSGCGVWAVRHPNLITLRQGPAAGYPGQVGGYPQPEYGQQFYPQPGSAPAGQQITGGYGPQPQPGQPVPQAYPQPHQPAPNQQPPAGYAQPVQQPYGPAPQFGQPTAPPQQGSHQPQSWQ